MSDDVVSDAATQPRPSTGTAAGTGATPEPGGGRHRWTGSGEPAAAEILSRLAEFPVPAHVLLPRGMLVAGEQRLLYRLACRYYSGAGAIIDAGAFCGASAYALAAGLSDNPGDFPKDRRIHSYDLFLPDDDYTRAYLQNNFYTRFDQDGNRAEVIRQIAHGEPFLDIFVSQTHRYEPLIQIHPGSILGEAWSGGPVEILFIDICKTLEIQKHVLGQFLPRLIPGRSILIQQDFHHSWHPYIHVVMEYLDPYFEIAASGVGASRVYRLSRPLPPHALQKSVDYEFSDQEVIQLLEQTVRKAAVQERPILSSVLARQLFLFNDIRNCKRVIEQMLSVLPQQEKPSYEVLFGNLCPNVRERGLETSD